MATATPGPQRFVMCTEWTYPLVGDSRAKVKVSWLTHISDALVILRVLIIP